MWGNSDTRDSMALVARSPSSAPWIASGAPRLVMNSNRVSAATVIRSSVSRQVFVIDSVLFGFMKQITGEPTIT